MLLAPFVWRRFLISQSTVEWYPDDRAQLHNGTSKTAAKFSVGSTGISFDYCVLLTHEPKHNTVTWTLDYTRRSSYGTKNYSSFPTLVIMFRFFNS